MFKKYIKRIGSLAILSALLLVSCTDLKIEETDSIFSAGGDEGFNGVEDVEGSLTNLDNNVRGPLGDQANTYALLTVSTDEIFVPTRGTDWGDNGIWRSLHQHTWSPSHNHILTTWNQWNQNVFSATEIIDERSNPTEAQEAEARFYRAYSMYFVMDFWGQVPIRQPDEGPEITPTVMAREDAYAFILNDLDIAIAGLSSSGPDLGTTRNPTKEAAKFLKARLLLNSGVYLGTGSPSTADMDMVISLVDEITAQGYGLQAGFFDIFKDSEDTETIWWLNAGVGNRMWNGLHYYQVTPDNGGGGWNGFSTLAEFYDMYEGDPNKNTVGSGQEERRGWVPDATNADETNYGIGYGYLLGQQYDKDGNALLDRANRPLDFKKELPGLVGNDETHGIRVMKYHPSNGAYTEHQIIFRYSDAHLMKAEAIMRGGSPTTGGDATALVNELREIRGAQPLGSADGTVILDERGRELYKEFTRRMDMIRFGEFTRDWEFKDPGAVGDVNKNLYPIPSNAILSNSNLEQNPGY